MGSIIYDRAHSLFEAIKDKDLEKHMIVNSICIHYLISPKHTPGYDETKKNIRLIPRKITRILNNTIPYDGFVYIS